MYNAYQKEYNYDVVARSDPGTDQDEEDPGVKTDCQSVYFSDSWNSGTGTVVCNILWNSDDLKSHQFEIWNEL